MGNINIWHCTLDSWEGDTYDVHIRSADRPTNLQIAKAIKRAYSDRLEFAEEALEELEILAYKIDDEIIDAKEL